MVSEVRRIKLWLACQFFDHNWNRTRGFRDVPVHGARCKRCGKIFNDRLSEVM